jgi:hypothetical protein
MLRCTINRQKCQVCQARYHGAKLEMSVSIKFGTLLRRDDAKTLKKLLDFGEKNILNTSLMHSWRGAMGNFPLL